VASIVTLLSDTGAPLIPELIVMAGNYDNEYFGMYQHCTPASKAVLMVNPGDTASITSNAHLNWGAVVTAGGTNIVIDGLHISINGDGAMAGWSSKAHTT
jgi:hypothetical protein